MKRNGSYASSAWEREFEQYLVARFGDHDVERQASVNGWKIDFKVRSLDTYVQFDGEYWHGLDRPHKQLRASASQRDKAILGSWKRDRDQDAWFAANGLRLVRVTDRQFKMGEVTL